MRPDDLLAHADELLSLERNGRPRDVDKRRAVSAAYYALFHQIVADCAHEHAHDEGLRYRLIYRSVAHARIEQVCKHISGTSRKGGAWAATVPAPDFDENLRSAATTFVRLKAARHAADYAPDFKLLLDQARTWVQEARLAKAAIKAADDAQRRLFLTLLLCDPRG